MVDHNPYEAPTIQATKRSFEPSADDIILARYAQMLLRVIGVFLTIEGAAGVLGSIVYGATQAMTFDNPNYGRPIDLYSVAWFTTSFICCVGGLYLVIGGVWVLEKVFLPSSRSAYRGGLDKVDEAG